eukprot:jgi/Mesvir1/5695/Mv15710-RA.1
MLAASINAVMTVPAASMATRRQTLKRQAAASPSFCCMESGECKWSPGTRHLTHWVALGCTVEVCAWLYCRGLPSLTATTQLWQLIRAYHTQQ